MWQAVTNAFLTGESQQISSRTLKVRGGIISQANRYLGSFCSSQRIFLPQIIQVLLSVPSACASSSAYRRFLRRAAFASFRLCLSLALCCTCFTEGGATGVTFGTA